MSIVPAARRSALAASALLALLHLASPRPLSAALTRDKERKPAPDFALTDSKGATVKLSDYKGKVVLLNFWATWCHGCQQEIPWFVEFEKGYKASGLQVIGVSMDEDGWTSVTPYLKKKKLNYPIVIGSDLVANSYGLETMPLTILIDKDGRIAATYSGVVDRSGCERELQTLMQASPSH